MKPLILTLTAATALVVAGLASAQTPPPPAAAVRACGAKVRAEGLSNGDILAIAGAEAGGPVQEVARTPLRPQTASKPTGPLKSACKEDYSVTRSASQAQQCALTTVADPADKTGKHMLRVWTCDPSEVDLSIY
jgi:hypothetical protein